MILHKISRSWRKVIGLSLYCITLAIFCQVSSRPASALDANDFYFQGFSADYYLSKAEDSTSRLKVVERLTAIFPDIDQNHGITRIIPYTNQDGKNLTTASDSYLDLNVKHNGIAERPYSVTATDDGFFYARIGDPVQYVHGRQVYDLTYEFKNVITAPNDNPGHQELYWDANGNDWPQHFERVTARVHFADEEIAKAFDGQISCYVGEYGEKGAERCEVTPIADGVEFTAENVGAYEGLTFDLEFDDGTFVVPGQVYDYRVLGAIGIEMAVAIVLLIVIMIVYRQTNDKREYYRGLFVTPEYTPPHDFTVAEMAENYTGQQILGSSKVTTLMELAVNHKVELSKVGTEKKPQWTVKILSTDLSAEQTDMLKILAGNDGNLVAGEEILIRPHNYSKTLSELSQKYGKDINRRLVSAGLRTAKPQKPGKEDKEPKAKTNLCDVLSAGGVIWVTICLIVLPFALDTELPSYVESYGGGWLVAAAIILAIAIAVGAFWASEHYKKFYTHTKEGLKWSRYMDGLKLYIKMAEQDRIKLLQSVQGADTSNQGIVKLYEKLLPYAIIFRLENSWLAEMGKYYEMADVADPSWYIGGAILSADDFRTAMQSVSTAALFSDMAVHSGSSGSSSGSSGSGGGGFSGGGGGGGGGGGW